MDNENQAGRPVRATPDVIFEELSRLYWAAVKREAENMIEFHVELREQGLSLNHQTPSDSGCDSFKKIFNVWLGGQAYFEENSTSGLLDETLRRARGKSLGRYLSFSKETEPCQSNRCPMAEHLSDPADDLRRSARLILQTSSLLDIDVLYEPTVGSQRSMKVQRSLPNIEQVELENAGNIVRAIRGISCSKCDSLIRSATFYECGEGCESRDFYEFVEGCLFPTRHECAPDFEPTDIPTVFPDARSQSQEGSTVTTCSKHSRYRLCAVCMTTAESIELGSCSRDHLSPVYYEDPNISNSRKLRIRLSEVENGSEKKLDGEVNANPSQKAKIMENILTSTKESALDARLFLHMVGLMTKGHYAPTGNFHLSLMFGPLIIESGVPGIRHGVLISPRPPPTLFTDSGQRDWPKERCPFFYRHNRTGEPELDYKTLEIKPRIILACVKRVYGAAFSGYPESAKSREADVIDCLVSEADKYGKIRSSKKVAARRKQLDESAKRLTHQLRKYLGTEVDKHLNRIAKILIENKRKTDWSIITNNCQLLVNRLLRGKDFEYIIPRFPSSLGNEVRNPEAANTSDDSQFCWPRYLLSFGNHIEGFGKSFYQPNCAITNYCQSMPIIDYDLIEYVNWWCGRSSDPFPKALGELSSLRHKSDNNALPVEQLWLMPGNSLSILQFHLLRQPHKYYGESNRPLRGREWIKNRLHVMQLLDNFASFTGALGVSLFNLLARNPHVLSQITIPPARVLGNMRADEKLYIRRLGSRGVVYDITNRIPSAMSQVVNVRRGPHKDTAVQNDPVHGEEVLSRIIGWFVTPLSLVSPAAASELGGIFRLHNDFWITVNINNHTYIRQYLFRKVKNTRD